MVRRALLQQARFRNQKALCSRAGDLFSPTFMWSNCMHEELSTSTLMIFDVDSDCVHSRV